MQQFALYRTTLLLLLLYKNNCKGVIYDYGNDECPCDQSDSSCLVLTYLDGEELKRIEKCADIWQAEAICHDYRSKLANIVSCNVEQQILEDSPNIMDVETITVKNIDVVKRDIENMWYRQMDSVDVMDIPTTTEDPSISDTSTTEDESITTETDSSTEDISITSSTDLSSATETAASNDEPDQPSSTSSSTTEGSVTRTPRPLPNSGNKVNLSILYSLFCVVAVCLNLSSVYLNIY